MRRLSREHGFTVQTDAHELQALGEHTVIARPDLVGQQEKKCRVETLVRRVDQDGPLL